MAIDPGLQGSHIERVQDGLLLRNGYYFSVAAADHVCNFIETFLIHSKGEWAGQPVVLEPWQRAKLRRLFGWKRPDHLRRYRRSWWWIPRKNGKSTLAAAVGLYLTIADGEFGAEVYSAASEKEQAKIVFEEGKNMVVASPDLAAACVTYKDAIRFVETGSVYRVLSAKAGTKHGLNVHGVIIDEVHTLANRALYDVLTTASGSRRQPLEFIISTAGDDIGSFAYELWEYSLKCRDGVFEDPEFLPVVYAADPGDDWRDVETWKEANPNLGVSKKLDSMKSEMTKVEGMPGEIAKFKQLHLNIWTQGVKKWLDVELWRKCIDKSLSLAKFAGRKCWGGLDLSKTTDLSSLALVAPNEDGTWDAVVIYWCPEENAEIRAKRDRVQYPKWITERHIRATPGNVVDYDKIRDAVVEIANAANIQDIGFDRQYATGLVQELQDDHGITMAEFGQGYLSMAAPTAMLERLVLSKKIHVDANPVTTWQASNVVVVKNAAGDIKPHKDKSRERIDGIVALVMALGRASVGNTTDSVYEEGGVKTL